MTRTDHWWGPWRVANTASNAAFPLVGLALAIQQGDARAWAFAASMMALGLGSGLYHWRRSRAGQLADWFSMVCVLLTLDVLAADAAGLQIHWWMLAIGFGGAGLLVYALNMAGEDVLIGLAVFLAALPPFFRGWEPAALAGAAMLTFLLAKWAHNEDRHAGKHWGHSAWHCLAAVAFGLLYLAITVGG